MILAMIISVIFKCRFLKVVKISNFCMVIIDKGLLQIMRPFPSPVLFDRVGPQGNGPSCSAN